MKRRAHAWINLAFFITIPTGHSLSRWFTFVDDACVEGQDVNAKAQRAATI